MVPTGIRERTDFYRVPLDVLSEMIYWKTDSNQRVHKQKGVKRWGSLSSRKGEQNNEGVVTQQETTTTVYLVSRFGEETLNE